MAMLGRRYMPWKWRSCRSCCVWVSGRVCHRRARCRSWWDALRSCAGACVLLRLIDLSSEKAEFRRRIGHMPLHVLVRARWRRAEVGGPVPPLRRPPMHAAAAAAEGSRSRLALSPPTQRPGEQTPSHLIKGLGLGEFLPGIEAIEVGLAGPASAWRRTALPPLASSVAEDSLGESRSGAKSRATADGTTARTSTTTVCVASSLARSIDRLISWVHRSIDRSMPRSIDS